MNDVEAILSLGSSTFNEDELASFFDNPVWLTMRQNLVCQLNEIVAKIATEPLSYKDFMSAKARLELIYTLLRSKTDFNQVRKAATFYAREQGIDNYRHPKDPQRMSRLRELLNSGRWLWRLK
jgi:hypothetical protein